MVILGKQALAPAVAGAFKSLSGIFLSMDGGIDATEVSLNISLQ